MSHDIYGRTIFGNHMHERLESVTIGPTTALIDVRNRTVSFTSTADPNMQLAFARDEGRADSSWVMSIATSHDINHVPTAYINGTIQGGPEGTTLYINNAPVLSVVDKKIQSPIPLLTTYGEIPTIQWSAEAHREAKFRTVTGAERELQFIQETAGLLYIAWANSDKLPRPI